MENKNKKLHLRLHEYNRHRIQKLADLYADGNVSLWLTWGALNAPRQMIDKSMVDPNRKRKRKSK